MPVWRANASRLLNLLIPPVSPRIFAAVNTPHPFIASSVGACVSICAPISLSSSLISIVSRLQKPGQLPHPDPLRLRQLQLGPTHQLKSRQNAKDHLSGKSMLGAAVRTNEMLGGEVAETRSSPSRGYWSSRPKSSRPVRLKPDGRAWSKQTVALPRVTNSEFSAVD